MCKACLLLLCLLALTPTASAQDTSRPDLERIRRARLAAESGQPPPARVPPPTQRQEGTRQPFDLNEWYARIGVKRPAPAREQRPIQWLSWPPVIDQPLGPIPTLSDLPEYDGPALDLNGFNGLNLNFWSKADEEQLHRNLEGIHQAAESARQAAEALKQLNLHIAVPNPSAAPGPARLPNPAHDALPSPQSASAASHAPSKRLHVEKNRVLVRANRNGFPIGTLFGDTDDVFVATYRDGKKIYVEGYAKGNVQKPGWVKFKDTFGEQKPPATRAPKDDFLVGEASRDFLLDHYAFVTNDINKHSSQPSPARIIRRTGAFQNYTNGIPLDPLDRQLLPYDPVNNPRKFAWRWITDDGKYVMGRECRADPATGKCADGAPTYWVYVSVCDVAIPGFSFLCQQ